MKRWLLIAALAVGLVGVAATASAQSNGPNQVLHTQVVVSVLGSGGGSVTGCSVENACIDCPATSCGALVKQNTSITLTATPDSNSVFAGWNGLGGSGAGTTCNYTAPDGENTTQETVSATFNPKAPNKFTLNVSRAGTGSGQVGGDSIDCGGTCSASYDAGTSVTLNASPNAGSMFAGWSGDCSG